jgi:hypothetical protein
MHRGVAIVATANINNLAVPGAMGGSGCSALKASGSNQDPKRTDSTSGSGSDNTQQATAFEESLHSTIKDQEESGSKTNQKASARGKRSQNDRNTPKLSLASLVNAATTNTVSDLAVKSQMTKNGQQPGTDQVASANATPNALAAVTLAALINELQLVTGGGPSSQITSDTTPSPATVSASKSDAISDTAASVAVSLESQIQTVNADQDTLVFDGTLHPVAPVAPVVTAPPQTSAAGTGKAAWLLNAQAVYIPAAPRGAANTAAPDVKAPAIAQVPQPEPPAASIDIKVSAPDNAAVPEAKMATIAEQTPANSNVNASQQKPGASAQENHAPAVLAARPIQQHASDESSPDNLPDFAKETKHGASTPEKTSLDNPSNAAPMFTISDSAKKGVEAASQPNNATGTSSKAAILPIDQQADIRQPSMKTDLTMRIQGQSGENINVRISERAGDIQISVRSSDQSTASVLKHELPSIEAGLERAGWRVENGGMSQSGQEQQEPGRDSQNPDRNRDQNAQSSQWQDRNQRRKDSSPDYWFEMDQ